MDGGGGWPRCWIGIAGFCLCWRGRDFLFRPSRGDLNQSRGDTWPLSGASQFAEGDRGWLGMLSCSGSPPGRSPEGRDRQMFSAGLPSAGRQYFKTVGEGQRSLPLETHQRATWCPKAKNGSSRILYPVLPHFLCLGMGRLVEGRRESRYSDAEKRKLQTDLVVLAAKP